MAAPASISTSHCSLHTPDLSSLSSSKPTNFLAFQYSCDLKLSNSVKPISRTAQSSFPPLKSNRRSSISRFIGRYENVKRVSFKPSVSAQHESQPHQRNGDTESGTNEFQMLEGAAYQDNPSSLKTLLQAYKEAYLDGDQKTISEIENIMILVEKEKYELAGKVTALSAEISSGKKERLRLQADFDNYRKRTEKDRLTARSNAQGNVIGSLLPMVDSFEKAKQQIKLETDKEKKIDASYQGIYKQFVEIMRSLRVAVVSTVGKPFDPTIHEAIAREESQEYKEGIIIQEVRRGFVLGDRLIRPAIVKVSSGPGKKKQHPLSEQAPSVAGADNR